MLDPLTYKGRPVRLPKCSQCGTRMQEGSRMVYRVGAFCPNSKCSLWVQMIWIEKADLALVELSTGHAERGDLDK